jgi:hypothetical protein
MLTDPVEILRSDFPEFVSTKTWSLATDTEAFPKSKLPPESIAEPPLTLRLTTGEAADFFSSSIALAKGFLQPGSAAQRARARSNEENADPEIPGFFKIAFLLPSRLPA